MPTLPLFLAVTQVNALLSHKKYFHRCRTARLNYRKPSKKIPRWLHGKMISLQFCKNHCPFRMQQYKRRITSLDNLAGTCYYEKIDEACHWLKTILAVSFQRYRKDKSGRRFYQSKKEPIEDKNGIGRLWSGGTLFSRPFYSRFTSF